jgi:hypothetical protein
MLSAKLRVDDRRWHRVGRLTYRCAFATMFRNVLLEYLHLVAAARECCGQSYLGRRARHAIRLWPLRLSTREWTRKPSGAASLIPNFDFVAIRVGDVGVGVAWAEFASPEQLAAGVLDFVDGRIDVAG